MVDTRSAGPHGGGPPAVPFNPVETSASQWCKQQAARTDTWLASLFATAVAETDGASTEGSCLVAVGGYGRSELAPLSDIDIWLVHDKGARPKDPSVLAERIWYPIWDAGIKLGHGVGTVKDVLGLCAADLDTATTFLSARAIAGNSAIASAAAQRASAQWHDRSRRYLAELADRVARRHAEAGEVAFVLEPDLKEGRGGLRDVHCIWWAQAARSLRIDIDDNALRRAYDSLLAARVALHQVTGRSSNVLALQDQHDVAVALGYDDEDDLAHALAAAGRQIAWTSDEVWHRIRSALEGPRRGGEGQTLVLAPGIVRRDGEIHVTHNASGESSPLLALQAAAIAATHGTVIDNESLSWLASEMAGPVDPWPEEGVDHLVALLLAGSPAVRVIEALDQVGIWVRVIPEWAAVRNRPQRNAYHTYTVDRHLIEAAVTAAALVDRVDRPDLLVLGALLHDLGKGGEGDHSETGVVLARSIGRRLGLPATDIETLAFLVQNHLLLAETATRRDLDDSGTIAPIADVVETTSRLDLLAALTEADSLATGPAAWGSWKADLVNQLVERTRGMLDGGEASANATRWPTDDLLALVAGRMTVIQAETEMLTVVAPDRPGLFSRCAGVIALHGLAVHAANAYSDAGMALAEFHVQAPAHRDIDWDRVIVDVERALTGRIALRARLAERARAYAARVARHAPASPTSITFDNDSSAVATIIEVHTSDSIGLLHRITDAMSELDLDIRTARVHTLGPRVVDAFYVVDSAGTKITATDELRELERAIRHAVVERF